MATTAKLTGVRSFRVFKHQTANRAHGRVEEGEASSPREFSWANGKQEARLAVGKKTRFGEIRNTV